MVEEPVENPSETDEETSEEAAGEILAGSAPRDEYLPDLRPGRLQALRHSLAQAKESTVDFLRWIIEGKARLSAIVGIFAALVAAVGFAVFDIQHEQWMLEQEYPHAISSDERYTLYARDLMATREYSKAERILGDLLARQREKGLHADSLYLLGRCLAESATDPASANRARRVCEEFIEEFSTDPRVPSTHRLVAENLALIGLYDDSTARYKRLLRMVSDEKEKSEIEFLIARNYYNADHLPATLAALRELRQKYVGAAVGHDSTLLLARTLIKYERNNDAEDLLRKLADEAPGTAHGAAAVHMLAKNAADSGDHESAITYCRRWLRESLTTEDQPDIMLLLAHAKLNAGLPEEALAIATSTVTSYPNSPRLVEAIVLQGRANEALGRPEEAEASYIEAADLAPDSALPYRNLARLYRSTGRLPEALEYMKLAVEAAPDDDFPLVELTKLYRLSGDSQGVLVMLETFTYERPLSPLIDEAFMLSADIHAELGEWQKAYKTLERLDSVGSTSVDRAEIYAMQGDILAAVELHDDALERYRSAQEIGANPASMKQRIGEALLASDRPEECLDEVASIELESQPPKARFALMDLRARALIRLERYAEARQTIRRAVALRSGEEKFSTLALLMHANLALGDEEAASEIYELTLKLIETDESAAQAPPESRRIILEWAGHLYDEGEYARAADAYSNVSMPNLSIADMAWALYQQGNCHYNMEEYDRADEFYSRLANEFSDSEWMRFAAAKRRLISAAVGT